MFSWIWADAANVYDVMQSWHQEFKGLVDVHVFCLCFLAYCAFVSKVTHLALRKYNTYLPCLTFI